MANVNIFHHSKTHSILPENVIYLAGERGEKKEEEREEEEEIQGRKRYVTHRDCGDQPSLSI